MNSFTNANGTDNNRQRVGLQISVGHEPPSTGAHIGYGVLMGSKPGDRIDRAFGLFGNYLYGLDSTAGTWEGAPVMLGAGHRIAFDGVSTGGFNRSLRFDSGLLVYQTQLGNAFTVGDAGDTVQLGTMTAASIRATTPLTPAASSAACSIGQQAWDTNYEYRCVATNSWKRAALSTW